MIPTQRHDEDLVRTIADGFERVSLAITLWTQSQIDLRRLHAIRLQSDNLVAAMTALANLANAPAGDQNQTTKQKEKVMAQPQDDFAALEANFTVIQEGITSANTGVQALDAQILAFQNSPGTLSPEDQARLDAIVATSNSVATAMQALATAANAPVGPTPPAPVPAPTVTKPKL